MDRPRIVSVHEYELRPGVSGQDFERAARQAQQRGLFALPGLVAFRILRGIKGARRGRYAAIWVYRDRAAWEAIWGPPAAPKAKHEYPEAWRVWEDELLAPLLERDPDRISYTSYEEILGSSPENLREGGP